MPYQVFGNSIAFFAGEITTKDILDREMKEYYDLVAEARDQGQPSRSTRVAVKISVLDVNDNAPEIVDPQEDVVSVREEQIPGTEVVRIRAIGKQTAASCFLVYAINCLKLQMLTVATTRQ